MKFIATILSAAMLALIPISAGLSLNNINGGSEERVTFRKLDEGEALSFTVSDDSGSLVSDVRVWNAPKGSTFKDNVFSWTPDVDQSGMYTVSFSTRELATMNYVFTSMRIVVKDTYFSIVAEEFFEELFTATDPDDDNVEITLTGLPSGATFTGTQFSPKFLSWKPTKDQIGVHQMTLTATDYPEGGEPMQDISIIHITVLKKPEKVIVDKKDE